MTEASTLTAARAVTPRTTEPDDTATTRTPRSDQHRGATVMLGVLRISLGWVLLWAGLDKVFALGFSTQSGQGIIDGASATEGYLQFGLDPEGPAFDILSPLAGNPIVDTLYLASTVGAGLALMLGVVVRLAAFGGAALMLGLWFSSLPLEFNPFMDQHLFYVLVAITVAVSGAGRYLGLGRWWSSTALVKSQPWLT